jgi:hypothetical protein
VVEKAESGIARDKAARRDQSIVFDNLRRFETRSGSCKGSSTLGKINLGPLKTTQPYPDNAELPAAAPRRCLSQADDFHVTIARRPGSH